MSLFLGFLALSADLFIHLFVNNEGGFINTEAFFLNTLANSVL